MSCCKYNRQHRKVPIKRNKQKGYKEYDVTKTKSHSSIPLYRGLCNCKIIATFPIRRRFTVIFVSFLCLPLFSVANFAPIKKKYLDLVDNNEPVIVKRRNGKAYAIVPITATEIYLLDPQIKARLERSIGQAAVGQVKELTLEKQIEWLGQ